MTSPTLLEALVGRPLLGDGAMGTQLQQAGLPPGGCGEAWNLDRPDRVVAIHRAYVDAGSDCLISNTFGASRIMLERHEEGARVGEINRAGARLARQAFDDAGVDGYVLGDVGPFGGILEPYGDMPTGRVADAFAEQARELVAGGVDAIIIETQTALEEVELAIEAARAAAAPCVIASMAFDVNRDGRDVRTMMGVSPERAAEFLAEAGVDVLALNCGTGIDMERAAATVRLYRSASDLPVMAQPNAGQPELDDLQVVYKQPPEEMAAGLGALLAAGARIVGGCCGSTPEHIRRLREALDAASHESREAV